MTVGIRFDHGHDLHLRPDAMPYPHEVFAQCVQIDFSPTTIRIFQHARFNEGCSESNFKKSIVTRVEVRFLEQRQKVARGVSRGFEREGGEPRSGERKPLGKPGFYRPFRGLFFFALFRQLTLWAIVFRHSVAGPATAGFISTGWFAHDDADGTTSGIHYSGLLPVALLRRLGYEETKQLKETKKL